MDCQLMGLTQAGARLPLWEQVASVVARKISQGRGSTAGPLARRAPAGERSRRVRLPRLRLEPGELVRIKAVGAIQATLDHRGRCNGLPFMSPVQDRFCGGSYRVKKRVDRFFDENRWRLLRLRDVVILEGVFCEPGPEIAEDWAGCRRTCFLFWKEAWLERVAGAAEGGAG